MKQTTKQYSIVWVAYNEENTLLASFLSALKAIKYNEFKTREKYNVKIVICYNGCTDKTPEVAESIKKKYSNKKISINVLSSKKGMVVAQNTCVQDLHRNERYAKSPIVFIDADSIIKKNVIYVFLNQFRQHPKLKAVGAQPKPISYQKHGAIKFFLDKLINCRAYFPKSEITVHFAPEYHPYAKSDPQKIGVWFELHSKIYFHGRCFALKDTGIWDVPENRIGEDTYLDRSIHYRFGPGSIRHMYDANVMFGPMVSLKDFLKTYYRIYKDLSSLKTKYPSFNKVREYSKTKLDWKYISKLSLNWQIIFLLYAVLRRTTHFMFKNKLIYRKNRVGSVWSYKNKLKLNGCMPTN
ncbi:MAG: glycosyltransferase family 2 protein [Patescibacteria group bacterium]|nr:glycosyltransferase family 2 protein [Patescibacteria group bacterium]